MLEFLKRGPRRPRRKVEPVRTTIRAVPRITITADEFRALVDGETVRREGVSIALADIGFQVMLDSLGEAIDKWESKIGGG
jgi:hypothetical protein